MRSVLVLLTAIALVVSTPATAGLRVTTLAAEEDLSLPFACDWGYDWDERCYWDDLDRIHVGGVDDKIWRGALRFPVDALPDDAVVSTAELRLWYDGTCVGPRGATGRCDGRPFALDTHPIFTAPWRSEREVEFGFAAGYAEIPALASPGPVVWDVTDLVVEWHAGELANGGLLLRLVDGDEALGSGGPSFPSSSHGDAALRPRLTVWYASAP